jgi:Zn-dependent protease
MDIFGTVIFPMIGIALGGFIFGWAKPVPIDPRNFKNFRKGLFWVSFAGPLSNILLGFIFALVFVLFQTKVSPSFVFYEPFAAMLYTLVGINFVLAIFNLIPIPPLDGAKMVESFLNYEQMRKFVLVEQYAFYILLFFMFSGVLRLFLIPAVWLNNVAIGLAKLILLGL